MIKRLSIRNFKCFHEISIPLKPLTILSGGNGVGKSSVVQALLIMRQTADQMKQFASLEGVRVGPRIKLNEEYRMDLGNTTTLTNADIESDTIVFAASGDKSCSESTIHLAYEASTTTPSTSMPCTDGYSRLKKILSNPRQLPIFTPEFHYIVAERVGPRDLQPVADQSFISTGFAGEYTAYAIAEAEAQNFEVGGERQLKEGTPVFRTQLEAWMGSLVPGIQFYTRTFSDFNKVQMQVGRQGSKAPPLPPANTGFGISYALPVIVSGLLASKGSMLIVENPEAHLHPAAQSAIGVFLATVAASGVQVIVETHSENVLNGVRLAALHGRISHEAAQFLFLSHSTEGGQPEVHAIAMNMEAELDEWPSGFFDQQSADLMEMVKVRRRTSSPTPN